MFKKNYNESDSPALPETWIVPLRLLIYAVLAGCSAYIYFNVRDLEITHLFIFLPVAAVCAMVLLDCKMSAQHWQAQSSQGEAKDADQHKSC